MRYILLCFALLAACQEEQAPAPTAEESARLNDVEAMLDNEATPPSKQ